MSENSAIKYQTLFEQLNFLFTNRLPRRYATLFMGWFSKLENPIISKISIWVWQLFSKELDLSEAKTTNFSSLHDCFIRQLKPDARSIDSDPRVIISPCDAIVGSHGQVNGTELFQTKGFPYTLIELFGNNELVERYRDGLYITLRLKATMYHRFHAPTECQVKKVNYISGDTWNVNPIALKRIEKLYCKNERAVIDLTITKPDHHITLVPVAAILVAGIKLHCLPNVLDLRYKGPNHLKCQADLKKGDEMGYFQHGSTIIVFANSKFSIDSNIHEGDTIRMGQALLHMQEETSKSLN